MKASVKTAPKDVKAPAKLKPGRKPRAKKEWKKMEGTFLYYEDDPDFRPQVWVLLKDGIVVGACVDDGQYGDYEETRAALKRRNGYYDNASWKRNLEQLERVNYVSFQELAKPNEWLDRYELI